jgi:hypothetical protein
LVFALFGWVVAAGCVLLSMQRLRSVTLLVRQDPERALEGFKPATRERGLQIAARGGSIGALVGEVLGAPDRAHAIATINERLADVGAELDRGADVPKAAARIALAAGTMFALLELARGLSHGTVTWGWGVAAFAGGLVGAAASAELGRLTKAQAERCREAWNRLARLLASLAAEPSA